MTEGSHHWLLRARRTRSKHRPRAKHGFRVFATARNVSTMTSLEKAGCGVSVSFFASGYRLIASQLLTLDVTDGKSILAAKAEVVRLTDGRLDLLINNVSDRKVS